MNLNPLLTLVLSLFGFSIFGYLLFSTIGRRMKMKKRLDNYFAQEKEEKVKNKKKSEKNRHVTLIQKAGSHLNAFSPAISKWEKKLVQGRSALSPGEFFLFRILALITAVLIAYMLKIHYLFYLPVGIVAFWLPVFQLNKKISKRLTRSAYQLSEALGTMANSMRAGFSFMQAMKLISEEFPDPIGTEFEKTLKDINLGVPVEEAFMKMLQRLPDKELEMAVKSMLIQRASGGNLAVLLETIQETVTGRIQIKEEVRTLTAQGKLSTWIITGLPVALALYLKLVNPEYFNLLLEHPLGWVMLSAGGMGIVMGWFFIRKIVRIEV
ncbi:type II secretion system F family protein [Bacillus sp. B-jedd]|uniref:type II secretion system F family protein n=1 Tax=Bacillus sp. B-jedd TaxID=1476857 RepID=UPI000515649E|nr:type II secretion system F family protein [Bacillus sp. B-jedd]CEG28316.1 Bacterial type II secretion system protein F domain protein [Bacillus sp. B-jedd]